MRFVTFWLFSSVFHHHFHRSATFITLPAHSPQPKQKLKVPTRFRIRAVPNGDVIASKVSDVGSPLAVALCTSFNALRKQFSLHLIRPINNARQPELNRIGTYQREVHQDSLTIIHGVCARDTCAFTHDPMNIYNHPPGIQHRRRHRERRKPSNEETAHS